MQIRPSRAALYLAICAVLVGCGDQETGPQMIEATGVVTLDDVPVEGATVFFNPATSGSGGKNGGSGGKTAVGETDAEGRFSMQTNIQGGEYGPGVVAGNYQVTVEKLEGKARKSMLTPPKDLLPRRYRDRQTSELTATVSPDQANEFSFALQK